MTAPKECARCHRYMNPLGLPFEAFDDFGRFRTVESMEHPDNLLKKGNGKTTFDVYPTEPVVTTGRLDGSGDPALDGPVDDPFELIDRLAKSTAFGSPCSGTRSGFSSGATSSAPTQRRCGTQPRLPRESGGSFRGGRDPALFGLLPLP